MRKTWTFTPPRHIELHIAFQYHQAESDVPSDFTQRLQTSDVYIPELFCYDRSAYSRLCGIAAGDKNSAIILGRKLGSAYGRRLVRLLTEITPAPYIALIDLPYEAAAADALWSVTKNQLQLQEFALPFDEALARNLHHHLNFMAMNRRREQYMLVSLQNMLHNLRRAPEFATKKKLSVYMTLGPTHGALIAPLRLASAMCPDFRLGFSWQYAHCDANNVFSAAIAANKDLVLMNARHLAAAIMQNTAQETEDYIITEQRCMRMSFAEIREFYNTARAARLA